MADLSTLKRHAQRLLGRLFPPTPTEGEIMPPRDGVAIPDGVDYSLPVLLPHALDAAMTPTQRSAYLSETAWTNAMFQWDGHAALNGADALTAVSEDPLREWNWATREQVLTKTHAAFHRNPLARAGVRYTAAFVVGAGFNLTTRNPDVDKVLNDFIDNPDNVIREYERQAVIDLQVDGELLLRFFDADGQVVMVPQRPWECQWIQTEKGFYRRAQQYHFQRFLTEGDAPFMSQTEIEDVPAASMLHVAVNRHGYELRGRPDLYTVLPWLKAYKDWMEDRARQNHWRGALLWLVRVATTTTGVISAVRSRWHKPPASGSVAVESDKVSVEAVTNPVAAGDAAEDGRQLKLMVAVGMSLPEYMLADGSNANRATSSSQQLPALTTFGDYQRVMIEQVWYPVFKRVLQVAIDAEQLPAKVQEYDADDDPIYEDAAAQGDITTNDTAAKGTPKMIDTLSAFDVSYASLSDTDRLTLAQALQIAKLEGWVDDQSATEELGFDYAIVQKRLELQRQAQMRAQAEGTMPTPPDGMNGQPDQQRGGGFDNGNGNGAPNGQPQPKTKAMA